MDWPEFDSLDPCLLCVVYTAAEETKSRKQEKIKAKQS